MTKSLKVKILAVLLTVLLAMGGLFLANTTRVNASSISTSGSNTLVVTSFVMREGASIRLGDGTGDTEQMGIKFVANLSNSEYQALRVDFKNVKYGVFIMPKAYVTEHGPINYDNCFGESAIYYSGKTPVEGKTRIHNIETLPKYVEEKDYKGFIVQGSIINMKTENLHVELIGVPYIKAELDGQPYYAFAQNAHDNVRTVVQVAQNLLDKNGYNANDPIDGVKQDYVKRFLEYYETEKGENFKTSYNAEFYLMNSKGEYVLDASKTTKVENVEMSSDIVAQTVVAKDAPAHDGYLALTGLNAKFDQDGQVTYDSKLLKVDGSTTLKFIYQEDKGNMIFNDSMINGNFGWSSPAENSYFNGWSMSGNSSFRFSSEKYLYYGTGLSSTASKNEDGSYKYGTENTGRDGWKLSNIYFPTTTNKISFWYVNYGDSSGNIKIQFNAANDGLERTSNDISRTLGMHREPYKAEIVLDKEIGSVNHMIISTSGDVYIDNIAWEKDLYVEQKLVAADKAETANLGNLKQNLKSTKYTADELASVEVSNVSAQAISSGTDLEEKVAVVNNNGTYTLTGLESKGYYEYTAKYTLGEKTVDGKGFVRANSGISVYASFNKYLRDGNVWYEQLKGDYSVYMQDQTAADLGLLHMSSADFTYNKNGVINGSIYKMGIDGDGYSLRVYPGRTNWDSNNIFYLAYRQRWANKTAFEFTQAQNMTMVCFFVYNPTAQNINIDGLYKHNYMATIVDADGKAIADKDENGDPNDGKEVRVIKSFSLPELKPGWNYVEHDLVGANVKDFGAVNLTALTTRQEYVVTSSVNCLNAPTLLFDSYAVR